MPLTRRAAAAAAAAAIEESTSAEAPANLPQTKRKTSGAGRDVPLKQPQLKAASQPDFDGWNEALRELLEGK